jgi:hypothetical protein
MSLAWSLMNGLHTRTIGENKSEFASKKWNRNTKEIQEKLQEYLPLH